ncbi:MAG: SDR family oxidoreductase [Chloroflexi bacterium]|nr:SDR family oxidoreductase [Chloroflexota bacterium]MXX51243.1 SDR family oxidoreductase [Chloroflexota bacterium]MXX84650.1 SDR family oxidoreductase [Chloroflexota bacterium]MYA94027.1 SDR family oxidoreductase [Chloroflexota bacterium]MYC54873.1 SDR family oxidoreductase [Chloroflexota bacterium]
MRGQIAVVTGGGGGIGSAICRRLAAAGAQIVITYNNHAGKAQAVADTLAGAGHLVLRCPVDDAAAQKELARAVSETYGRLDILVNNAGISKAVAHEDLIALDDELIDRIFRVNFRGAFASLRALQPLLRAGEGGVVINISSIAGRTGVGSNVAYCASKAALDSMTRSLARALAPQIRVLSVSPGWVNGDYAQRMPRALIAEQEAKTPLGRIAEADDVAAAVYAAIAHLRFSTGDIIPVDGGRPLC